MTEYKVMRAGEQVGSAEAEREGLFLTLRCTSACFPRVMRLYGVTKDEYVPIGVPVPVGGRLRLTKKYSGNDLRTLPFEGITHFELFYADETPVMPAAAEETGEPGKADEGPEPEPGKAAECAVSGLSEEAEPEAEAVPGEDEEKPAGSPWRAAEDASALFDDPELRETASVIKEAFTAQDGDSTLFAIPISSDTPFPLMPVFRYGWSAMVNGKFCIVFRIRDGRLI